jgi:hypothetical protein
MSVIKFGTHNSGTSYGLVWWQKIFAPIFHLFSRNQSKSIEEQLLDGVNVFNFQVIYYKKRWHFSHGLCLYSMTFDEIFEKIRSYCIINPDRVIYFQLAMDKNFFIKQDIKEFNKLLREVQGLCLQNLIMLDCNIEGSGYIYINRDVKLDMEEHYWSKSWQSTYAKKWYDKLPIPFLHAHLYNKEYISKCKSEYLMLDYYDSFLEEEV